MLLKSQRLKKEVHLQAIHKAPRLLHSWQSCGSLLISDIIIHIYTSYIMSVDYHEDHLSNLDKNIALGEKIASIHQTLKAHFPFIVRIAAALYDEKTDTLKTYVHSSEENTPLVRYEAKLAEIPSLHGMLEQGQARVINNLSVFSDGGDRLHSKHIQAQGYHSSYTMPMYERGAFFGFLFFNSYHSDQFTKSVLVRLSPFGHLIKLAIINELKLMHNLLATVKTARDFNHLRDDETCAHQDRMSRFARLIAQKVADKHGLTDEHIESIFIFSPLHDIGKMGIPDHILLKPHKLSDEEFVHMKTHTSKGRYFIDQLLENFSLEEMPHVDILRNITELHHEALNGSGYPYGHKEKNIPIEARIAAVADRFDALTSRRPYKHAWSNDEAFDLLKDMSGSILDPDCVNALLDCREEIEAIQQQFGEDLLG